MTYQIEDGRKYLAQWDTGQRLIIDDPSITEVDFSKSRELAAPVEVITEDGLRVAKIPDVCLQQPRDLLAWFIITEDGRSSVVHQAVIPVLRRQKPDDYVEPEDTPRWADLYAKIEALETNSGSGSGSVVVDSTLTVEGQAADAKATGDAIRSLSEEIVTTAESKVSAHNTGTDTHSDIRLLISGLTDRLNALADSDDTTLDQLSEIVAYIKRNRELIASITTDKVSVADIIDNLTTNVANKPLSAAQGVALKALIDGITIPDKLPNPNALTFTGAVTGSYDGSEPLTVEIPSGGGRTLALIADVTTSEETNMISIDKDLNGNAFTIRDYALRITIPAHTRSERATFYARTTTYGGGLTFTNMLVTDGAEIGFFVYPIASYDALDLLDGSYPVKVQSISSRGANAHESAMGFLSEASSVQVYTNSTTVLFPAGVNVQVYGVRK